MADHIRIIVDEKSIDEALALLDKNFIEYEVNGGNRNKVPGGNRIVVPIDVAIETFFVLGAADINYIL